MGFHTAMTAEGARIAGRALRRRALATLLLTHPARQIRTVVPDPRLVLEPESNLSSLARIQLSIA